MPHEWLLYGATGYSGGLIAREAVRLGLEPILAGRGANVRALADELKLDARVFDVRDADATRAGLSGVGLVLNCAGPFSATAAPMIAACLDAGAHYLDITGEIPVFEHAHAQDVAARARGVVLCPGVGFDVVPTDCLAAALKEALPDATSLALGFDSRSPLSQGTAKTMIEGLPDGGKVRRDGRIVSVPLAAWERRVDMGSGVTTAITIPWGDVATAYYSTGIGNIACWLAVPPRRVKALRRLNYVRPLLRMRWLQRFMKRRVERGARGPDDSQRTRLSTAVWGEASNAAGRTVTARVRTANGYTLTVDAAIAITRVVLERPPGAGGYFTPSQLCGWRFVETLPGSGPVRFS
ncbi:MAG: saccharopine dehydrogenase NADP-binding domain-containing protein [Burkholderiales bacterium]